LEIYVIGVDGSGVTRLTNNRADDYLPAWSPDGSAIAFTAERDGSPQVYVMNVDGSGQTRLTDSKNGAMWPSWTQ
jgi:TolB protein